MKLRNLAKFIQNLEELEVIVLTDQGEVSFDRVSGSKTIQDRDIKFIQVMKGKLWRKEAKIIVYI